MHQENGGFFRSTLNEWNAEREMRDPSWREVCPLSEVCWHHSLNVTDYQPGSITSRKSGTNKGEWDIKDVRNSQCPPIRVKTGVSWDPGEANTPQMQQGIWKSNDILQFQAETSSPQNQSHNQTNPPMISNHVLKDTGRTERKWRYKWVFGYFLRKLFQTVWFSSWWIFKNSLVSFYFHK